VHRLGVETVDGDGLPLGPITRLTELHSISDRRIRDMYRLACIQARGDLLKAVFPGLRFTR